MMHADDMDTSDKEEEVWQVKGQEVVYQPSREEWDDHMCTRGVFRNWCPSCTKGKCKPRPHRKTEKSEEEFEQNTPAISLDYVGPKSGEDKA